MAAPKDIFGDLRGKAEIIGITLRVFPVISKVCELRLWFTVNVLTCKHRPNLETFDITGWREWSYFFVLGLYRPITLDIQVYASATVDDAASAVDRFDTCLTEIEAWLRGSRLKLNPTKTQVMWLGSSQQLAKLDISLAVRILPSSFRV